MKISNVCAMLAVAGLAATAAAQDSVSANGGLPGDAGNVFDVNDQVDNYVLDLTPFTTGWGTEFGIGVLHKAPTADVAGLFFGSLVSAQAMAQNSIDATTSGDYAFWTTPGAGVTDRNDAPGTITLENAPTWQQASLFATFAGDNQSINGAIINVDKTDSSRLYVTRVLAATNQSAVGVGNTMQAGIGGVDASGNAYFRMDDFGTGPGAIDAGTSLVRIRLADRGATTTNQIQGPGVTSNDAGAVDNLLVGSGTTHSVPQAIAAEQFGGNGAIGGPNFSTEYVFGAAAPLSTSPDHLSGSDHRGAMAYTGGTFGGFANPGIATMAITGSTSTGITRTIDVFAIDSTGAPITASRRQYDSGNLVTDSCNGFNLVPLSGDLDAVHHDSQTAFRGGAGQVDVVVLPNGDLRSVITMSISGSSSEIDNGIVSFTEDANTGLVTQELVAYTTFGPGKAIVDGPSGNVIGNLLDIDAAFGNTGPSITSPALDAAGNVWFVAPFELNTDPGNADTGLFRAVRRASGCWDLELVVRSAFDTGTTWTGANSGREVRLTFLSISDSNSISSGAMFSSNANAESALGQDISMLPASDPRTLGGFVLSGTVIYDADADGDFDDPSGATPFDPTSLDEEYNALVYIGALTSVDTEPMNDCVGDFDGDGDVDLGDFGVFGGAFGSVTGDANYNPAADFDMDGDVDLGDFGVFGGEFGRTDCLG